MKGLIRNDLTARVLPGIAILSVAIMYCMTARASDFIDIIRMTENHPSIKSAQSGAGAALFDVDAAKAPNNVQLSVGLGTTGYSGQPGYENNYLAPHLSVSKVLYDHGRNDAVVAGKESEYQMQRAQIKVTRESLNQQALSLYTTALTSAKTTAILDDEIVALKDLLQRVQSIALIDSGRASEVNQVSTRLSAVVASREASNMSRQQAWQQLALLVDKPITLNQELPDLKQLNLLPGSLEEAEANLKDNPSYIVARYKRDAALAAVQVASKWNRPTWSVQLSLNSPRNNGEMEPFKAATVQLNSDMNLWDGGSGAASAKSETQRLASTEQDSDALVRNLRQQLAQLWIALPLREQQIAALSMQSSSALQTWHAGETQFFAGQRPLTDLISFATDYYSSLASYEEQRVQYIASQWQIVSVLGKLSDLAKNVQTLPAPALKNAKVGAKQNKSLAIINSDVGNKSMSVGDKKAIEDFKQAVSKNASPASPVHRSGSSDSQSVSDRDSKSRLYNWPSP